MPFKNTLLWISAHALSLLLGFLIFVVLFQSGVASSFSVFFYRGCLLILIGGFLNGIAMLALRLFFPEGVLLLRDIVLSAFIVMSFNLVFFTHLPVTADRSVTVFMLGYMADGQARTNIEVRDAFVKRYVDDYTAIDRRFNEQIVSGNIQKDGDHYRITPRGAALIRFYDWMTDVFHIDKRFVRPHDAEDKIKTKP